MTNRIDLASRIAVVTGGAQGIGRAIVERMLDSGAQVAIWDRDVKLAERAASELSGRGRVQAVGVDVTDLKAVEAARDATLSAFNALTSSSTTPVFPARINPLGNILQKTGSRYSRSISLGRSTVVTLSYPE